MRLMTSGLLAAVLALAACNIDFTGLERLSEFTDEIAESMEVAAVGCMPDTVSVGESGDCIAVNASGTNLVHSSLATVIWESSDPSVAPVDLNGHYTGRSVGTSVISATGPEGSSAADTVTVN